MSSSAFQERFKGKTSLIPKEGVEAIIKDSDNPISKPSDHPSRMMLAYQMPEFTAHQRYANQKREAHTFDQNRPFFSPTDRNGNQNIYSATYSKQQQQQTQQPHPSQQLQPHQQQSANHPTASLQQKNVAATAASSPHGSPHAMNLLPPRGSGPPTIANSRMSNNNNINIKTSMDSIDKQMEAVKLMMQQKLMQQQLNQKQQQQQQVFEAMQSNSPTASNYSKKSSNIKPIIQSASQKSFTPQAYQQQQIPSSNLLREMSLQQLGSSNNNNLHHNKATQQQLLNPSSNLIGLSAPDLPNGLLLPFKNNTKASNGYNLVYSSPTSLAGGRGGGNNGTTKNLLPSASSQSTASLIEDDSRMMFLSQQQQQQQYLGMYDNSNNNDFDSYNQEEDQKHRYRPYTLNEYKNLQKQSNYRVGGLGPNTNSEDWKQRKEQLEKRQEFAKQIQSINSQVLRQQQEEGRTAGNPASFNHHKAQKEISVRERALEFAKNIPKPGGGEQSYDAPTAPTTAIAAAAGNNYENHQSHSQQNKFFSPSQSQQQQQQQQSASFANAALNKQPGTNIKQKPSIQEQNYHNDDSLHEQNHLDFLNQIENFASKQQQQ